MIVYVIVLLCIGLMVLSYPGFPNRSNIVAFICGLFGLALTLWMLLPVVHH